jgi:hypothetical protein
MSAKCARALGLPILATAFLVGFPASPLAAFQASDVVTGYTCMDSEEASPNAPTFAWDDISVTGTPSGLTFDDQNVSLPIGFTFNFMASPFTTVGVCSNGFFQFTGTSTAFTNGTIPSTAAPNNALYGFWDDLYLPTGGEVRYQTLGVAPARRFVVSWLNVPHISGAAFATVTFQMTLFETGGATAMRVQYQTMTGTAGNGSSATVGIENAAGTASISYEVNGAPATNNIYNNLAIGFWPTTSTPPWVAGGGGGGGGGSGAGAGGASRDNANGDQGINDLFCPGGAATAASLAWLALALGAALSLALPRANH